MLLGDPCLNLLHIPPSTRQSAHTHPSIRVGLIVSGGHSSLYRCSSAIGFTLLGGTIDDAAGEAFDKVASLLGQKTVLNEWVAYASMREQLTSDPGWLSERSRVIASYALCGFANFGSIGIQIGGYASLAPERRADFAKLGPRAIL